MPRPALCISLRATISVVFLLLILPGMLPGVIRALSERDKDGRGGVDCWSSQMYNFFGV